MPILHLWTKTQVLFHWGSLKVFPLSCDLWGSLWEWRKKKKNHNSLTKITRKNNIIHTVGRQQILWHPCPLSPPPCLTPFSPFLFFALFAWELHFAKLLSNCALASCPLSRRKKESNALTYLPASSAFAVSVSVTVSICISLSLALCAFDIFI